MDAGVRRGTRILTVAKHVLASLALGALVGYLAALVLPRRKAPLAGGYQAPVPERVVSYRG